MTRLHFIGIGTGNPDHLTRAAERAIADADLILIPHKGAANSDLADLREQIVQDIREDAPIAHFDMPVRDPDLPYLEAVARWHDAIAAIWARTIAAHPEVEHIALLIWGDPSLYDSSLRIAERLAPRPEISVIPGITALQALTAAHAIPLNTLNGPVTITTGRQLRNHGWPQDAQTLAVMLDGACAFETLDAGQFDIWWGAYLGMEPQLLFAGPLSEMVEPIKAARASARARHGWIMDTYLLRRR